MDQERFFGHWTLTVTGRGTRVRLVLTGTDAADGVHLPTTEAVVLDADGVAWRMSGERLPRGSEEWQRFAPTTTSSWDRQVGLTRQLTWAYSFSTGAEPGHVPLVSRSRVVVDCRSHDPDLAAVSAPDPPEFSVPEIYEGASIYDPG